MSIREQLLSDIKDAMKAKQMEKLTTLRTINAAIKNEEINNRPKELTNEDVMAVLKKLAKQRKDSIDQFQQAKRQDLVDKEVVELEIIQGYLPDLLGEEKVREIVKQAIADSGASSMKDMGGVMKAVMAATKGAADNKLVSEIVKSLLNG